MKLKKSMAFLFIWVLIVQTVSLPLVTFADAPYGYGDLGFDDSGDLDEFSYDEDSGEEFGVQSKAESDVSAGNSNMTEDESDFDDIDNDSFTNSTAEADLDDGFGGEGSADNFEGFDLEGVESEDLLPVFESDTETIVNPMYVGLIDADDFVDDETNSPTDETESFAEDSIQGEEEIPLLFSLEDGEEFASNEVVGFTSEKLLAESEFDESIYTEDFNELVLGLRDTMEHKRNSFKMYWKTPKNEKTLDSYFNDIMESALEHTGVPTQGDYIRWGWGTVKPNHKGLKNNGMYYLTFDCTINYYLTEEQENELSEAIDEILESLNLDEMDDLQKIRTIYDYICESVSYDRTKDENDRMRYTAYSAVFNKTAVCQGYALLLYRMALQSGIDNRIISGNASSVKHAWQIINYNGLYYNMDETWDANYAHTESPYVYFMRCDSDFQNHTRTDTMRTKKFYKQYPMAKECLHTHDGVTTLEQKTDYPYKESTCVEEGYQKYTQCDRCGKLFSDKKCSIEIEAPVSIKMKEHSWVEAPEVAPTCEESGLTAGEKCENCGTFKVEQQEISALGHIEEVMEEIPATCTETGLKDGKKCSACGKILEEQTEIPALGHTVEVMEEIPATCTETGLTEGKKCSVCGEILEEQTEIPAFGHTEEVLEAKAATCTETGLTEGKKCSVCGETLEEQNVIPALGHTEMIDKGVPATISSTGLTDGKHCTVCDAVTVEQKVIPKLTTLQTPVLAGIANGADGVHIKWNVVEGAEWYRVFRKTSTTNWTKLTDTTVLSYIDTTAMSGKAYIYTVRCLNENKTKYASNYDKNGKTSIYLSGCTVSKIANVNTGGLQITWNAVSGAKGYVVYRKDGDGFYSVIKNITNGTTTTYKDTTAKTNGQKYTYAVRAYSGSYKGVYVAKTYYRLGTHTISSAVNNAAGKVTVKWNANRYASGYQVLYKTGNTYETITITSKDTLSTVISSLKKGQTYHIYVRGFLRSETGNSYSAWSVAKTIKITR